MSGNRHVRRSNDRYVQLFHRSVRLSGQFNHRMEAVGNTERRNDFQMLRDQTEVARLEAVQMERWLTNKPHRCGLGDNGPINEFELLVEARANLRAALASVSGGIEAVVQWRNR